MSDATMPLTDTSDMISVHDVFRRALADAPGQLATVTNGGSVRAEQLGSYLGEVLWFLHAHHDGEDELLYPLLVERAPESAEVFTRMGAQHAAVVASVETARRAAERLEKSGSADDGEALSAACRTLLEEVTVHLSEEESLVLPIASRTITPSEWGALPAHAFSRYPGARPWLVLGLVFEAMSDGQRAYVLANLPTPASQMWLGFGSDAFDAEMAAIRAGAS